MKVQHSVVIRRPLEEVFAFVTDLRNETRWQPEIVSVTIDGPLREGAIFHERRVTFGRRYSWCFRITRLRVPHVIEIETITGTAPYRGARTFEAVDGGTRVTERGELELPWILRPSSRPLGWLSNRCLRVAYGRLARMLEAGAGGSVEYDPLDDEDASHAPAVGDRPRRGAPRLRAVDSAR